MRASPSQFFADGFRALTGNAPFGWQKRLFDDYFCNGHLPTSLDLPTGFGKTSVIVIWLLALAWQAEGGRVRLPRRLVYVVNRRTVVDQATVIAEQIRAKLKLAADGSFVAHIRDLLSKFRLDFATDASPLAISTLRGELADNREWQSNPSRPAIIVGTVDMIGSRLLFSGYGVSQRMRPFHAGLLGHDTLLLHDEAHLSPAFAALLRDLAKRQRKAPRPVMVMELSATQRSKENGSKVFTLQEDDEHDDDSSRSIRRRFQAEKRLTIEDGFSTPTSAIEAIVERACSYAEARVRVLVYVRTPDNAKAIADELAARFGNDRVSLLTGTMRGHERDQLVESELFLNFKTDPTRQALPQTLYLVATSAGEVGVDLDADHMVCDLSTLDSMIQRLGRVNRLGCGSAKAHVLELPAKGSAVDERISATKAALRSLSDDNGGHDASPQALRALVEQLSAEASLDKCFSKRPRLMPLTDILIDNWSLTRVDNLLARPAPATWLHGVEAVEPDLYVAWREEVSEVLEGSKEEFLEVAQSVLKTVYDKHPILTWERMRGPLHAVRAELERIARRRRKDADGLLAVLLPVRGDPIVGDLSMLLESETDHLPNATIVLPCSAGGLDKRGMLSGSNSDSVRDVADKRFSVTSREQQNGMDGLFRARLILERDGGTDRWSVRLLGQTHGLALSDELDHCTTHRQVAAVVLNHLGLTQKGLLALDWDHDGQPAKLLQLTAAKSVATAQDDTAAAAREQELDEHLEWTGDDAERIIRRCELHVSTPEIAEAVVIAARWHDRGKNRLAWQKAIGHGPPTLVDNGSWKPWAKSGRRGFDDSACGRYRHEFGSLREAAADSAIGKHPERDLILHLIAAHHGWARPHFEPEHWDIADDATEEENEILSAETMRRFGRLQRRFGHWGLAWLEALVRAADYAATARLNASASV